MCVRSEIEIKVGDNVVLMIELKPGETIDEKISVLTETPGAVRARKSSASDVQVFGQKKGTARVFVTIIKANGAKRKCRIDVRVI